MNARTGNEEDFIVINEKDMNMGICRTNIPSKRNNCDTEIYVQGEKLLNLCKSLDLQILNGRNKGDTYGNFTHFNKKAGASTIDYAISSDNLIPSIKAFHVLPQNIFSDHCKIEVRIGNIKHVVEKKEDNYNWQYINSNYKWEKKSTETFQKTLRTSHVPS